MCGGTLEITNNETVATCEYCGTMQTLPKLDDDKRANMYDRANHFRRNNEFDKAMGIYEQILNEDNTDAESYWSLVLCRYGIEYVEDPATHKRVPTVNRAQFTSIFDDDNYKSALKYADGYQKSIYEEEAKAINEIQKGILAISQNEEPFDIFICYKESDASGKRTHDSVLANDLYHQLTQEGFKVFFARITLEDKLGSAYEPYIFAALNSSKVMVVLGTNPEFFNAVWVKNEWSRYLALIKQGEKKMLIPAYKDMDPYDLPEEFSHLQAQDMSRLGFMQDLIRGIKKIVQVDAPQATVVKETVVTGGNSDVVPLLKRAFMFLEDGDWGSADEYCEKVLDIDPENAQAYLGKLMSELEVKLQDSLKDCVESFDTSNNYQKAVRFADGKLKEELVGYIDYINNRNENARVENTYNQAISTMQSAKNGNEFNTAANLFKNISEYKDSAILMDQCFEKAEIARKDSILAEGKSKMRGSSIYSYKQALSLLNSVSGWKDADEQIVLCCKKIDEFEAKVEAQRKKEEIQRKRNKVLTVIGTVIICAIMAVLFLWDRVIQPSIEEYAKYSGAIALMNSGDIVEAYEALVALDGYKDSSDKASSIYDEYRAEKLKAAKVGDYVFFGAYEQDNNTSNGKEDIEWLVLEVKDGKALVISKNALDCKQYNTNYTYVTWETCTLRKWLNNDFINSAFSADEKAMIPTVTVSADKNPEYNTNPGNSTQDQVFLLSITEANKYFSSDSARQCKPSDYAVANGAFVNSYNGNCWWLLRSPGYDQTYAAGVGNGGVVYKRGYGVSYDDDAVRPTMWIDLNS